MVEAAAAPGVSERTLRRSVTVAPFTENPCHRTTDTEEAVEIVGQLHVVADKEAREAAYLTSSGRLKSEG